MIGTCPVCWTSFQPVGRQRFCSGNCRKAAWSRRQDDPRHQHDLALLHDRALLDAGQETGFWDDNGRPAPLAPRHRRMETHQPPARQPQARGTRLLTTRPSTHRGRPERG